MNKKICIAIIILILLVFASYKLFSEERMERRIISSSLYNTKIEKAKDILKFSIYPKEYLKTPQDLGKRKLIMQKYDTKVYFEPMIDQGEDLWVWWSFQNDWYKREGKCFTFENIISDNGKTVYGNVDPLLKVTDENGNRVNKDWGGGGTTYNYGFRISKEVFKKSNRIDIELKNFNLMTFKLKL